MKQTTMITAVTAPSTAMALLTVVVHRVSDDAVLAVVTGIIAGCMTVPSVIAILSDEAQVLQQFILRLVELHAGSHPTQPPPATRATRRLARYATAGLLPLIFLGPALAVWPSAAPVIGTLIAAANIPAAWASLRSSSSLDADG